MITIKIAVDIKQCNTEPSTISIKYENYDKYETERFFKVIAEAIDNFNKNEIKPRRHCP